MSINSSYLNKFLGHSQTQLDRWLVDDKMAIKVTSELSDLVRPDRVGSLFMAQKSRDNWSARSRSAWMECGVWSQLRPGRGWPAAVDFCQRSTISLNGAIIERVKSHLRSIGVHRVRSGELTWSNGSLSVSFNIVVEQTKPSWWTNLGSREANTDRWCWSVHSDNIIICGGVSVVSWWLRFQCHTESALRDWLGRAAAVPQRDARMMSAGLYMEIDIEAGYDVISGTWKYYLHIYCNPLLKAILFWLE